MNEIIELRPGVNRSGACVVGNFVRGQRGRCAGVAKTGAGARSSGERRHNGSLHAFVRVALRCLHDVRRWTASIEWPSLHSLLSVPPTLHRLVLLAIFFCTQSLYAFSPNVAAKKITSDGSLADTQAAINYVRDRSEDGWELTVGTAGGSYTWSGPLTVDAAGRKFTMKGADPSNRPSITSTTTAGNALFLLSGAGLITLKDLKFVSWTAANALIGVYGNGLDPVFHFTNCYFAGTDTFFLWTSAPFVNGGPGPFGVIDHCEFYRTGIYARQNRDSPDAGWANNHWSQPGHTGGFGSAAAVFVEDSTITALGGASGGFDGDSAGKYVIRHNVFNNSRVHWHGRDSSSFATSCRNSFLMGEVYDNVFNMTTQINGPLVGIRGGTALVYNNALNLSGGGTADTGASLETHCSGPQFAAEGCRRATDCSVLTEPLQYPADYPDRQQAGFPAPVRVWRNTGGQSLTYGWASGDAFTQGGRDYFFSDDSSAAPSEYTPYPYPHPLNTGSIPTSPSNNIPPSVSGVPAQGQALTVTPGRWSAYPSATYRYQWVSCDETLASCFNVSGATSLSYTLVSADVGRKLSVDETATNSQGTGTKSSNFTEVVAAPGALNRLINGGFENRTGAIEPYLANNAAWTGWTIPDYGNGWFYSSITPHSGNYAFSIYKNGGTAIMAIEQQFIPANSGETMRLSFWQKNSYASYGLVYYVKCVTNNTFIIAPTYAGDSIGSYTKVETSFVVPAGCLAGKIGFDSSRLGAGGGTQMWIDDVVVAPPAVVIGCDSRYGDLNQDSRVDTVDSVILTSHLVGNLAQGTAPYTAAATYADLNESGRVDVADLVILNNHLVGNIPCLPRP